MKWSVISLLTAVSAAIILQASAASAAIEKPTGLMVFPSGDSLLDAQVSWSDKADNEEGYAVERRKGKEGTWEEIAKTAADAKQYTDSGLTVGDTVYYRVRAFAGTEYSEYSSDDYMIVQGVPWIRLSGPKKDDQYRPNDTIHITWASNRVTDVAIEMSQDDGVSWVELNDLGGVGIGSAYWLDFPFPVPDSLLDETISLRVREYSSSDNLSAVGGIKIVTEIGIRYSFRAAGYSKTTLSRAQLAALAKRGEAQLIRIDGKAAPAKADAIPSGMYLTNVKGQKPQLFMQF